MEIKNNDKSREPGNRKIYKKVLLLAPEGFEDLELAAFTGIMGWTRVLKQVKSVDLIITGSKRNIRSKHNLSIRTHVLLHEVIPKDYHALVILGGFNDSGWTEVYSEKVLCLIRNVYKHGGIIAAMCVGALPVAKSGILKGKKATTYTLSKRHDNLRILRDCGADAVSERIVVSGRIITNRGPDTSVDAAFKLLEMLNGKEDMEMVRKALMFDPI